MAQKKRRNINSQRKAKVWLKRRPQQQDRCIWCGKVMLFTPTSDTCQPTKDHATLEHIIPRGQGGTNFMHNLCLACLECNEDRGDRMSLYPDSIAYAGLDDDTKRSFLYPPKEEAS